jgi:NuA3 HAT complex component NTO1
MSPKTPSSRRTPTGRRRGRPPGSTNAARAARLAALASGPPQKRRRYIPGGAGGGGRFVEVDEHDAPISSTPAVASSRSRAAGTTSRATPATFPRRERSARIRTTTTAAGESDDMIFSSAAAVAAAVAQNEGYKPREERSWEEFHPNLDIDATFMVFNADDVDGVAKEAPGTPTPQAAGTPLNGSSTPLRDVHPSSTGNTPNPQPAIPGTPPKRRVGRPPRDPLSYYASRVLEQNTPRAPAVLPIHNQTPKERLDLKQPQYRKTDRILLFESKKFGQARYVDKAMMNVGYQESDQFIRPDPRLIKAADSNVDEDLDLPATAKGDRTEGQAPSGSGVLGRVEYDMDEQDDMWLETYNAERKANELEIITREVFEITITKIEKEWHALEKRIPKPNPKPPQTHRPRSSSAAAVNGEPQAGEEHDSKCAICDDGDCENTNAIVFCDGCDLAVHQECYGVPFIPEGQWLCRKCQLIGRGIPVSVAPTP